MTTPASPSGTAEYERLSVLVNDECADILRSYMDAHGCSATEATRRAIGVLDCFDATYAAGGQMLTLDPAGNYSRLIPLY